MAKSTDNVQIIDVKLFLIIILNFKNIFSKNFYDGKLKLNQISFFLFFLGLANKLTKIIMLLTNF